MSSIYYKNQKYTGPTLDLGSGSLTTDNKTIVGAINELDARMDALTPVEGSLSSESVTFNNLVTRLYKVGSIVMLSFSYTANENISSWESIATIPAGYRPPTNVFSPDVIRNGFYQLTPGGDILTNSAIEANLQGTMAVATWVV